MLSIYSSWFNAEKAGFTWPDTLTNWLTFLTAADEIVIAVNTSEDDTAQIVRKWYNDSVWKIGAIHTARLTIIDATIPYDDPEFDGKLKALALSHCKQPYAILLDCDEVLYPFGRPSWMRLVQYLEQHPQLDAFMIPVVDLYGDEKRYKCDGVSLGQKWYLHKNRPDITRGVVHWARRENGSIDITKSDTCELIYRDSGELVRSMPSLMPAPHFLQITQLQSGSIPFVYHLGHLNLKQRVKQDAFWEPIWRNRDKSEVKTAKTEEELKSARTYQHNLPTWRVTQL